MFDDHDGHREGTIAQESMNGVYTVMTRADLFDRQLPGADLVAKGLDDLDHGRETAEALLVAIGRPRLVRIGLDVPHRYDQPEFRLYALLAAEHPASAHARYNALIRRLVSFERAAECVS